MDFGIRDIAPGITGIILLIGWFIRLESKTLYNEKGLTKVENSIDDIRIQIDADLTKIRDATEHKIDNLSTSLNEVRVILARIEGSLSRNHKQGE
jgi:hypothetical protein